MQATDPLVEENSSTVIALAALASLYFNPVQWLKTTELELKTMEAC